MSKDCEKPISLTVDDATRMIQADEAHGVQLYVAGNEPYTPMARFLRHILQAGYESALSGRPINLHERFKGP